MTSGTESIPAMGTEPIRTVGKMHTYDGMQLLSGTPPDILERIKELKLKGDVVLEGYPKTGNTWLAEIAWLVFNDGNIEKALQIPSLFRTPFIDYSFKENPEPTIDSITKEAHPWFFHSHLPCRYFARPLQEDDSKFVISLRNPKDMLVSFYNFYKMSAECGKFSGTWDEFFEVFKEKKIIYGDYIDWCKGWWKYKDSPKVLFVKYEDMKKDLLKEVCRVITFLGKESVLTEEHVHNIVQHCTFDEMRKNKMTNFETFPNEFLDQSISPFIRKGVVGDWKNYFNEDQNKYVDEMCESLAKEGLTFEFS